MSKVSLWVAEREEYLDEEGSGKARLRPIQSQAFPEKINSTIWLNIEMNLKCNHKNQNRAVAEIIYERIANSK